MGDLLGRQKSEVMHHQTHLRRGYVDRQFTSDEAQALARRILELFMAVMATKRRAKGK
jgi:hypothetical protein